MYTYLVALSLSLSLLGCDPCVRGPLAPSKFIWKFAKFVLYQSALFLRNRFIEPDSTDPRQIVITRLRVARRETKFPASVLHRILLDDLRTDAS